MNNLPCVNCVLLGMCKSLMIKSMVEDYWMLVSRCSLIKEYLDYEENLKHYQISAKMFKVQDYLYSGKLNE